MIDGLGRGRIQGSLKASAMQQDIPVDEIRSLASKEFAIMLKQGYGNIEPQEMFLRGFIEGFQGQRLLVKNREVALSL